jgi:hypothetical protein
MIIHVDDSSTCFIFEKSVSVYIASRAEMMYGGLPPIQEITSVPVLCSFSRVIKEVNMRFVTKPRSPDRYG